MKIAVVIARILAGVVFVVFGSNAFLHFLNAPLPEGVAGQFHWSADRVALRHDHWAKNRQPQRDESPGEQQRSANHLAGAHRHNEYPALSPAAEHNGISSGAGGGAIVGVPDVAVPEEFCGIVRGEGGIRIRK